MSILEVYCLMSAAAFWAIKSSFDSGFLRTASLGIAARRTGRQGAALLVSPLGSMKTVAKNRGILWPESYQSLLPQL